MSHRCHNWCEIAGIALGHPRACSEQKSRPEPRQRNRALIGDRAWGWRPVGSKPWQAWTSWLCGRCRALGGSSAIRIGVGVLRVEKAPKISGSEGVISVSR